MEMTKQMMKDLLARIHAMQEMALSHNEEIRAWQKEMKGDWEATEAYPEKMEANPEEMESTMEHEEVPKEEATVESFGALKKRHGDQYLDKGHCLEP
jgi:hypothetical protein